MTVAEVLEVLRGLQFRGASETQLQRQAMDALFQRAPASVVREMVLASGDRLDLAVQTPDRLWAIEVKVKGPMAALERQLVRYALQPEVEGLIALTTRVLHCRLPSEINGKPVHTVVLAGAFL